MLRRLSTSHSRQTDRPAANKRQAKLSCLRPIFVFANFAPNFVAPALLAICFLNVAIVAQLLSEFIANLMSGNSMAYFRIFISFRVDHSEKFSCESNRMVANVQWDRQIW